jgi:hypothetical protein
VADPPGLSLAIDPQGNHRKLRLDEAGRAEPSGEIVFLTCKQRPDDLTGGVRGAYDGVPGLNRGRQHLRDPVHDPGGRQGMVDAAEAPGPGAVEFPLPGLRRIDRARREKTAHLPQPAGIGGQDEVRGALRAELLDEAGEALAKLRVPHIARHGFPRGVAGEGGEKAMASKVAPHRPPMGDLIGLGLEVDRCGQGSCPREDVVIP